MSIVTDIIQWVEEKPKFWQIAIDRLIRNNTLSSTDITDLKEILKTENGLSKTPYKDVDFNALKEFANHTNSNENVLVSKIENIENINALSNTSVLNFDLNGLNIVYGDNGCGKSSFTSILKHTCNTRGEKPLINPNIFKDNSNFKDKKAEVVYTTDKKNFHKVSLKNEQTSHNILKKVDVFDTYSANHYIEEADEIAFIPKGLSIIEKLAFYLKTIEQTLYNEIEATIPFDYKTIIKVPDTSTGKIFLNKLNETTSINSLKKEGEWNLVKVARKKELELQIAKLKATDPKVTSRNNLIKLKRFGILNAKYTSIEENINGNLKNIETTLNSYITSSNTLKASSKKAFLNLPMEGIGSDVWKELWESAKKFYNQNRKETVFPEVENDSSCPLCLQKLNTEAKERFLNFEEFVKDDIQNQYNKESKKYQLLITTLENITFDFTEQSQIFVELDEISKEFTKHHTTYITALQNQRDALVTILKNKIKTKISPTFSNKITAKTILEKISINLQSDTDKLANHSIEKTLLPLEKELAQLNGEKSINDFKPQLEKEIYRLKTKQLLKECIGKCNTRSITTFSNLLTHKYVNKNLKDSFKLELKKIGFNNIKVTTETKGSKGKQYHFLKLNEPNSSKISLKDVLSEGEHRCISFATFLSELSISDHKSTVIFDDPVSSMDHKWRNKIAKRIVEEALERQVIVFTHDITFLMMLQEHAKTKQCLVAVKSLTRKKTETGIIASNPPWDALTVKKRIGILNNDLQTLEKIEKTETFEVYNLSVKPFYGKLRETWERFIEEILLNKVIQRFGREIQTQRLKVLSDLTEDDYTLIDINMKKCSTYLVGHDSSGALIENTPDINDVKEDLKTLEEYLTVMRKRKRS